MGTTARIDDTAKVGDLFVLFGHYAFERERGKEPCMYLRHPIRKTAVCFPLGQAYIFAALADDNPTKEESEVCHTRIEEYAKRLYGEATWSGVRNVANAIVSRLEDLYMMPEFYENKTADETKERMQRLGMSLKVGGERIV